MHDSSTVKEQEDTNSEGCQSGLEWREIRVANVRAPGGYASRRGL